MMRILRISTTAPVNSEVSFGVLALVTGLAIIADTYSNHNGPHNHNHPYVSAMINNGSLHYDHDRYMCAAPGQDHRRPNIKAQCHKILDLFWSKKLAAPHKQARTVLRNLRKNLVAV